MADEQKTDAKTQSPAADTAKASKAATKAETEAPADVELPPALTLSSAARIAGAKNAQGFFDEVSLVCFGNVSDHMNPSLDLQSLQAEVEAGSSVHKRYLAQIQKIANDYAGKK